MDMELDTSTRHINTLMRGMIKNSEGHKGENINIYSNVKRGSGSGYGDEMYRANRARVYRWS